MSARTFLAVMLAVVLFLAGAIVMHTPAGAGVRRSIRALHGAPG